jgi:hypothetical protein
MRLSLPVLALLMPFAGSATIIDRIAVIVGNGVVKDSDIDRDIRVTAFLNGDPLDFSDASRKKSASHLIEQIFIRREIRIGDYPNATLQETDQQLAALKKQRFVTNAAYEQDLRRYRINDLDVRFRFQWQLTVLRFIDLRFEPAAVVTDPEIASYYQQHLTQLRREHPGKSSLEQVTNEIRDNLTAEKVNKLFFAWLDEQRRDAKVKFLEGNLA